MEKEINKNLMKTLKPPIDNNLKEKSEIVVKGLAKKIKELRKKS